MSARNCNDHGGGDPGLPRFLIIGAAKAATTWLSGVLRQQPGIFMPEPELHFFNRHHEQGEGWYAAHFAAARPGQLIGEKSASYLSDPCVPPRLHRLLPGARLVVQLRNPIERAYSDYSMLLRRGEVGRDIALHLDPERAPSRRFLDDGLYARHLRTYLALFPREQIEIVFYDDIARDSAAVFGRVAAFVGLEAPVPPAALSRRVKIKEAPTLPLPVRRLLRPLKAAVAPWRNRPAFRRVHGLLARPVRYPELDAAIRRRLAAYYAEDVRALEDLAGRDLGGWLRAGAA